MKKLVITFPDNSGCNFNNSSFSKSLIEISKVLIGQNWIVEIIPLLNGKTEEELITIARGYKGIFRPLIISGQGLVVTLSDGYEKIINMNSEGYVIRMDTAEHPVAFIPLLLEKLRYADLVVGDLVYRNGQLGRFDRNPQQQKIPSLIKKTTKGKLKFGGAHGFQSFSLRALPEILKKAEEIMARIEKKHGIKPRWGFDCAMILSAFFQQFRITIEPIQAQSRRDRPKETIQNQIDALEKVSTSASEIFGII